METLTLLAIIPVKNTCSSKHGLQLYLKGELN